MFSYLSKIAVSFVVVSTLLGGSEKTTLAAPPNFIIVFCDDLGYGDIGPFGSKVHATPVLDRMAQEGMRLTDFYSSCSVCTPSRASLLTGCYPRRVNMHVDEKNLCVLFPAARKGLNPQEVTIAEVLKEQGYATGCIGKWHLGDHPDFLPTSQGFDMYFGIPYSNDMNRKQVPLPLVRNETVIADGVQKDTTITRQYTEEAVKFIREHRAEPFFLYLPHTAVHLPLVPGKKFRGTSQDGAYGDWVQEVDWSMGEIFQTLKAEGLDENTLVLFTSDNGSAREKQGSNLPLRGRKGRTDEGGMRVPCIVRWPGHVPADSRSAEITCTLDLLPTFAALADGALPQQPIDGKNIWPILSGEPQAKSPREAFYYYQMDQLQAVRSGPWKLFLALDSKKRNWGKPEGESVEKLFHLVDDIHEDHNVAEQHPDVVKRLRQFADQARAELGDEGRAGAGQRPAGWVEKPSPRLRKQ
ncbi:MAG TPA: arylsulfatase [Planctomycetaceae bacterium]|nr:arylsulfatase [Blastopirellula sp.]HAY83086.1 arylsulfatase [Planctomycetaceae bacterium]